MSEESRYIFYKCMSYDSAGKMFININNNLCPPQIVPNILTLSQLFCLDSADT